MRKFPTAEQERKIKARRNFRFVEKRTGSCLGLEGIFPVSSVGGSITRASRDRTPGSLGWGGSSNRTARTFPGPSPKPLLGAGILSRDVPASGAKNLSGNQIFRDGSLKENRP